MTTIVQFNPQPTSVFRFSPVLDGITYSATVTWNVYGQRYYLNIYTVDGTLKLSIPLIGSPDSGFVESVQETVTTVVFVANTINGAFRAYPITAVNVDQLIINMSLSGTGVQSQSLLSSTGTDGNGFYMQFTKSFTQSVTGNELTLTFVQRTSLWIPSVDGNMGDINLTNGYFDTPIIYRATSKNFEIG